jgi:hypothetical protein
VSRVNYTQCTYHAVCTGLVLLIANGGTICQTAGLHQSSQYSAVFARYIN